MSTASASQSSPPAQDAPAAERGLTQESAFDVLSCERRRYVLHHLFRDERTLEVRELSEQVAAWENDVPVADVSYQQRMRAYTSLRQLHLPKLDEEGLVAYDEDRGTVALTDDAAELEIYLEVVPHEEIRWSKYYLGLSVLSAAAVAASVVGVFPLSAIPGVGWAALVTTGFFASAVAHSRYDANHRLGDGEKPLT